ncbi:MAG: hypothetical protein ACI8RD_004965 [Bacillariaceae sp.]|jgi:hypothetical protein
MNETDTMKKKKKNELEFSSDDEKKRHKIARHGLMIQFIPLGFSIWIDRETDN